MDQATLVSPDLTVGSQIISALDNADIKISLALFLHPGGDDDWRLVLSSPDLDQKDIQNAYVQLVDALGGRFKYKLPLIMILPLKDAFVRGMQRVFGSAKDVTGMRLGGQTIGNRFIEDAYVYRVQ